MKTAFFSHWLKKETDWPEKLSFFFILIPYYFSASMLSTKDKYKVVISYDFGTTFSGASYAFTHDAHQSNTEVFDVQKW